MRRYYILGIVLFTVVVCHSQHKETYTIVTTGAAKSGQAESSFEFYTPYRGAFIKRTLSPSISLLTGINQSRINNVDFLEFPLLFQYQFSSKLKVSGGPQFEAARDRETGSFSIKGISFSIGMDYQFTESWDASIQFIQPIIQKGGFDTSSPFSPNPIRLRTGFKF